MLGSLCFRGSDGDKMEQLDVNFLLPKKGILPLRKSETGGKEQVSLFLAICMCRQTLAADRVLDRKNVHI